MLAITLKAFGAVATQGQRFAAFLKQQGVPVGGVSERLGHARVDITLNIYRRLYEVERQAAALSLTDLLGRQERTRGDLSCHGINPGINRQPGLALNPGFSSLTGGRYWI